LNFDQLRRVGARSAGEPAIFNLDLAALGPAELGEPVPKRANARLSFRVSFRKIHQHADAPHLPGLLRAP
jgi:hypothetical protein